MRSFAFTLVPLIGLWSPSIAGVKGDDTKFSYPTSDLTFNSYDTIEVSYESSISSPKMVSFCRGSDGSVQQKREDNAPSLDGTVSIQLNFTIDSPDTTCWFNLRPEEDGTGLGGNSPNFKLDSSVADKNTYGVDSPKSTTSSSSTMTYPPTPTEPVNPQNDDPEPSPTGDATSSSSPSASTPSATASSSAAASTSAGLSQGAQAGIGVGVGLVGVISGGAAAFIFFRRRRQARDEVENGNGGVGGAGAGGANKSEMSSPPHYAPVATQDHYPHSPETIGQNTGGNYYNSARSPDGSGAAHEDPLFAKSKPAMYEVAVAPDYRGTPQPQSPPPNQPVAMRHEMEAPPNLHEMP